MNPVDLLSCAAVSAAVSGIVAYTVRTFIKASIENRYRTELEILKKKHRLEIESLKADLAVKANAEREVTGRRLTAYPKLVSLVYRTRNMARDLARHLSEANSSLAEELAARAKELEEALYDYRFDLENDRVFDDVHRYKNLVISFHIRTSDARYFIERGEANRADCAQKELTELYQEIDRCHRSVIELLTSHVPVEHNSKATELA
jgi:hypothetical protein